MDKVNTTVLYVPAPCVARSSVVTNTPHHHPTPTQPVSSNYDLYSKIVTSHFGFATQYTIACYKVPCYKKAQLRIRDNAQSHCHNTP